MEKKIELECDYCGVPITENDHKCPNCGANCTEKIKKYKAQQETISEEQKQKMAEYSKKISENLEQSMKAPVRIGVAFVAIVIIIISITMFVNISSSARGNSSSGNSKVTEIGYNEIDKTKDYSIILDSYELYQYTSEKFPKSYDTPEGYQKIAFHFIYQNLSDYNEHLSMNDIHLTADDYKVDSASLYTGVFEKVVEGKEKYPALLGNDVGSSEKLQGYVGFLVPTDKKILKFSYEKTIIIMDNPVYVKE